MRPHRTDGVSLTFAIIFFGVVTLWLANGVANLDLPATGWILALALIGFGVVGLLGSWRSGRARAERDTPPTEDWPGLS